MAESGDSKQGRGKEKRNGNEAGGNANKREHTGPRARQERERGKEGPESEGNLSQSLSSGSGGKKGIFFSLSLRDVCRDLAR